MVPQKEASPLLDKKISELEVKLADVEDDDIEDMEDELDAPRTPSMPQMQTPVTSDMDSINYTPSQVPSKTLTQEVRILYPNSPKNLNKPVCFLTSTTPFFPLKTTPKVKGLSKKEGAKRKINMSGYILFSSEMRAVIKARHPDFSFGELSRLVGTEWRNLEGSRKADYEGGGFDSILHLDVCVSKVVNRMKLTLLLVFIALQSEQLNWQSSRSGTGPIIRRRLEQVPQ